MWPIKTRSEPPTNNARQLTAWPATQGAGNADVPTDCDQEDRGIKSAFPTTVIFHSPPTLLDVVVEGPPLGQGVPLKSFV